jgi:hypothetical protein
MHGIGFDAKSAVPLNLMISLVTLSFAMLSRSCAVAEMAIASYSPEVIGKDSRHALLFPKTRFVGRRRVTATVESGTPWLTPE